MYNEDYKSLELEKRATMLLHRADKRARGRKAALKDVNFKNVREQIFQKFRGHVQKFSDLHYRIKGEIDVWPSTMHFYSIRTRRRGTFGSVDDLELFLNEG